MLQVAYALEGVPFQDRGTLAPNISFERSVIKAAAGFDLAAAEATKIPAGGKALLQSYLETWSVVEFLNSNCKGVVKTGLCISIPEAQHTELN